MNRMSLHKSRTSEYALQECGLHEMGICFCSLHKKALVGFVVALSAILLTACGSVEEVVTQQNSTSISFSWWGNDPRHMYTMDGLQIFSEMHPDIKVSYKYGVWNGYETRNRVYMNSHTEPDVMQINYGWINTYSPDGEGYYDIYELADYIDLSNFDESDMQFGEVNGKLNALPIAYNTPSIFYNKTIYDQYGLDLPTDWDDLFAAAEVMREDGVYPIGMVKKHAFLFLVSYYEQTTGKNFFDKNGKLMLTKKDIEYVLDFYRSLINEKVMIPIEQFDRSQLASGEVAGAMFWISDINNYCGSIEKDGREAVLGEYIGVKSAKKLSGWYMKPATMYAISKNSVNPKEAAQLLDFLLNNPDMAMLQQTEKGIPVSKSALNTLVENDVLNGYSYDANQKMLDERDDMNIMIAAMEDESIIDIFKADMDAYVYDKENVEESAENIYNGVKEYIRKSKNK